MFVVIVQAVVLNQKDCKIERLHTVDTYYVLRVWEIIKGIMCIYIRFNGYEYIW